MNSGGGVAGGGELDRLGAYAYLTVPDPATRAQYIAIMRVFTGTLMSDLSAHDIAERLAAVGTELPVDVVAQRLDSLRDWGDLLTSSRPVRATSISEYHRVRSRYQLSPLGEKVQRHAEEILAGADSAREVSRELLALVARGLAELDRLTATPGGPDPQEALERVSTVFAQFGAFADSVRDFYAYLGQVIFRYDLDAAEFAGFKELLLDYAETITDDVAHFAPQIERGLAHLWPRLPGLLRLIDDADQGLASLERAGVRVGRSRGRDLADWRGLSSWFFDFDGSGSEVSRLRDATLRALQALLANAKRMIRTTSGELSRRRDLLRLAAWLDASDDETAHDVFAAAFGMYGARHLGMPGDPETEVSAVTSWWHGPAVDVPVSLRERGSRSVRGRTARAEDYTGQQDLLRTAAEEQAARERAAAAELRAAARRLGQARLSGPASRLLLDLLARCVAGAAPGFASATTTDDDLDVDIELRRTPGGRTTVHTVDGDLVLDDLALVIGSHRAARTREAAG
jgi:uncharacterized protein (TIGR02677 family)